MSQADRSRLQGQFCPVHFKVRLLMPTSPFRIWRSKTSTGMRSVSCASDVPSPWWTIPLLRKAMLCSARTATSSSSPLDARSATSRSNQVTFGLEMKFNNLTCSSTISNRSATGTKKLDFKGKQWHEHCFLCESCQTPLGTQSFVPKNENTNLCVPCYEKNYADKCCKCGLVCALFTAIIPSLRFRRPKLHGSDLCL